MDLAWVVEATSATFTLAHVSSRANEMDGSGGCLRQELTGATVWAVTLGGDSVTRGLAKVVVTPPVSAAFPIPASLTPRLRHSPQF